MWSDNETWHVYVCQHVWDMFENWLGEALDLSARCGICRWMSASMEQDILAVQSQFRTFLQSPANFLKHRKITPQARSSTRLFKRYSIAYCSVMLLEGLGEGLGRSGGIFGQFLGRLLGHVCGVVGGMLRGFLIVLGKVFEGELTYNKPVNIVWKNMN